MPGYSIQLLSRLPIAEMSNQRHWAMSDASEEKLTWILPARGFRPRALQSRTPWDQITKKTPGASSLQNLLGKAKPSEGSARRRHGALCAPKPRFSGQRILDARSTARRPRRPRFICTSGHRQSQAVPGQMVLEGISQPENNYPTTSPGRLLSAFYL